jgi:hypothetical protein
VFVRVCLICNISAVLYISYYVKGDEMSGIFSTEGEMINNTKMYFREVGYERVNRIQVIPDVVQ